MSDQPLTGAQKSFLRGLGQRMDDQLMVGKEGAGPALYTELAALLRAHELVKVRFVGNTDRHARAALCEEIAAKGFCTCVGSVGHTALFYRPNSNASDRRIELPVPNSPR